MFERLPILINASIVFRYVNGSKYTQQVQYAFEIQKFNDTQKIKKAAVSKLLESIGKEHEVIGEIIVTVSSDPEIILFEYKPSAEKLLIPDCYIVPERKPDGFDKLISGAKKIGKMFDALMGEEPQKKKKQT